MKGWYIDDVTLEGGTVSDVPMADSRPGLWFALPSPNPMARHTTFAFNIPTPGAFYRLEIFDPSGRLVRTLSEGTPSSGGVRSVVWDRRNASGRPAGSGLYLARLSVEGAGTLTRKVIVAE
jgi:flagellar hook assembly protein FlgD